jgi:hypothetical protein
MPVATSTLTTSPLPFPPNVGKRLKDSGFGVVVSGVKDINNLTDEEFNQCVSSFSCSSPPTSSSDSLSSSFSSTRIHDLLYKHSVVIFEGVELNSAGSCCTPPPRPIPLILRSSHRSIPPHERLRSGS